RVAALDGQAPAAQADNERHQQREGARAQRFVGEGSFDVPARPRHEGGKDQGEYAQGSMLHALVSREGKAAVDAERASCSVKRGGMEPGAAGAAPCLTS